MTRRPAATTRVLDVEVDQPAMWIRTGRTTAIPSTSFVGRFAHGDPACEIFIRVVVRDGIPAVDDFRVSRVLVPRGPAITQRLLRVVGAVDKLMAVLIEQVTEEIVDAPDERWGVGAFQLRADVEAGRIDVAYGGRAARSGGRGRATADERLARVAEIYRAALAANAPPTKAVAEQLPCSYSHAARLVGYARAARLLPKTKTTKGPSK